MTMHNVDFVQEGNGSAETFDIEWREALETGDPRWLSYPASHPLTQQELVERVKADQIDKILDEHGLRSGRVMEYACGSAGIGVYLANCGFDVVALDISINAARLAQRNAAARNVPERRLALSLGDVFQLPFENDTFDVVMSYGLLEHFTRVQLAELLRETNRVLRPGGLHIVDIIHGRLSMRTVASLVNFTASSFARLARGRANSMRDLYRSYFDNYYENDLGPKDYARLMQDSGLEDVRLSTCRPFPMLALGGTSERAYVALLKALLPVWRAYDRSHVPLIDGIGWMYLGYGMKPLM